MSAPDGTKIVGRRTGTVYTKVDGGWASERDNVPHYVGEGFPFDDAIPVLESVAAGGSDPRYYRYGEAHVG